MLKFLAGWQKNECIFIRFVYSQKNGASNYLGIMNSNSDPRQSTLLLESLEARILYSAAPVGFFGMDTAPAPVQASHEAPEAAAASDDDAVQPLQPVSIENALNQVGAQIKPWGLEDGNGSAPENSVTDRVVLMSGAPAGETYVLDLEEEGEEVVSGPEEAIVLHSEPDSEEVMIESLTYPETSVEMSGEPSEEFSLVAVAPPERLMFAAAP